MEVAENQEVSSAGITPEIERYLSMWERDPKSRVFAPLAESYRKIGQIERAIEICQKGLLIHPNYVSGRVALGRAYFDKHDYAAAKTELEMVFEADPENLVAAKTLGEIYEVEGEFEKALLSYRLAHYSTPSATEIVEKIKTVEAALAEKKTREAYTTIVDPTAYQKHVEAFSASLRSARAMLREAEAKIAGESQDEDAESEKDLREELERLRRVPGLLINEAAEIELEMDLFFSEVTSPSVGSYSDFQVKEAAFALSGKPRKRNENLMRLTLTELMLRQGYVERAVNVYEEYLASEPDNEQALRRIVELREQLDDIKYEILIREGEPGRQVKEEESRKEVVISLVDWLHKVKAVG